MSRDTLKLLFIIPRLVNIHFVAIIKINIMMLHDQKKSLKKFLLLNSLGQLEILKDQLLM